MSNVLIYSRANPIMSTRVAKSRPAIRKSPRQARSRATVEAIVEAGARVLAERGRAGFSTNRVAAAAGVSIGSLYQYFPDKAALIEAIRSRHVGEVLAVIRQAAMAEDRQPHERVEHLASGLIAVHTRLPQLHRVLLEMAPRADDFESRYLEAYSALVDSVRGRMPLSTRRMVATVLSGAMEGAIHAGARSGLMGTARFREEVVQLTLGYLRIGQGE